ncbi:hypothetical protein FNV43_RR09371 [Rhamnella rubrinervis]|uniref:V-type proton ATPase subunit E n=1 Tax=Rhamnella rubrinervis TaxID=2594499 RepID=A0A8K0MK56_9ROSA|nr:hypothetical protein FNV43_RR09371 [Rhamnella rubrinervis]
MELQRVRSRGAEKQAKPRDQNFQTNKCGFQVEDLTDGTMKYENDIEEDDEDEEEDVLTNSWACFQLKPLGSPQASIFSDSIPSSSKMNDADVSKQIQQMVRFIRQEAEEKANEISVSAEEEFNIEKLQLVEAEKKKIRQEYERKEKQVEVRRKIEYSMQLNASRIKVLQAQDDVVNAMKDAASKELLNVGRDHHEYKKLLKDLIVQSLLRLKEPAVLLRCRKEDHHLVESVQESAAREYAEKTNVHPPEIIVDHNVYLPPGPTHHHFNLGHHDEHGPFCSGGVVLASRDGKIVCENTIDARLDVVFRKKLPEIRKLIFGQVAA